MHLRKVADAFGHKIVAEYLDLKSGKTIKGRDRYIKMMDDAATHKFDAIMTYKLDRLHRNVLDALVFVNALRLSNIDLIVTSQNIDTSTAIGRAMFQIVAVFAELESANTSERSKLGTERAKAEGKVCNRPKKELSNYQIEKAKQIIAEKPDISGRELAAHFEGINRATLIRALRELGVLQ